MWCASMAKNGTHSPDLIGRLRQIGVVRDAMRGDLRNLTALLRSGEPLSTETRNYLARELEQPTRKRFRTRLRKSPNTAMQDSMVIGCLDAAKLALAEASDGAIQPQAISDASAYDWLAEKGIDWVNEVSVNNARRRAKAEGRTWIEYASGKP